MGGTQRLAAVAAVSHARNYYNVTHNEVARGDSAQYGVNIFFISATLCGVVIAVCAACWPRAPPSDKPDDAHECSHGRVYTVSDDLTLLRRHQIQESLAGPPPAYESVVDTSCRKEAVILQEVIIEPNMVPPYTQPRQESGLPSYEAAVMLRDSKL